MEGPSPPATWCTRPQQLLSVGGATARQQPLLAAVDRVFAQPERTPGLTAAREPVRHVANRAGHAGLVEIWPLERPTAEEDAPPGAPLVVASLAYDSALPAERPRR